MSKLITINALDDIPAVYRQTPIGLLVSYHNQLLEFEPYEKAQLLVGMCMDNRKHLHIPDNFTFIIRSGGANLKYSEFKVSYAIAIGDIQHIALIGHNNCGMVNLVARKDLFIEGLIEKAGWDRMFAEEHFNHYAPFFEIKNEINFILSETKRLRLRYPMIMVAPLFYQVEDSRLYFIKETSI
jgi:carbonic anhydrase